MAREITYKIVVEDTEAKGKVRAFDTEVTSAAGGVSSATKAVQQYDTATASMARTQATATASATTYAKAQDLTKLSTVELDAVIAGHTTALSTSTVATESATAASGAYGSILFAQAEATTVATTATTGLVTQVTAGIAKFSLYGIAAQAVTSALVGWYEEHQKARLATETLAAKQDTINKALSLGAQKGIQYGDAIKYINEQDRHRIALNPDAAARAYVETLTKQAEASTRAAAEEDALTRGLADRGIVLNKDFDIQKLWNDTKEKATAATKKHDEAIRRWNDSIQQASERLRLTTYDLNRFGSALPNVESSLKGVDTEIHVLASRTLPNFGLTIYDIGQKGKKSFGDLTTAAQQMGKGLMDVLDGLPQVVASAFVNGNWASALMAVGSQAGSVIGRALGESLLGFMGTLGGPLGAALGSLLIPLGEQVVRFFKFLGGHMISDILNQVEDAIRRAKDIVNAANGGGSSGSGGTTRPDVPDSIPSSSSLPPWTRDFPLPSELPGFASGTGGRLLDFGAGTPVVLHGRERVVTEAEQSSNDGQVAGLLRAILLAVQQNRVTSVQVAGREILRANHTAYDHNEDGAMSELQQLLGAA